MFFRQIPLQTHVVNLCKQVYFDGIKLSKIVHLSQKYLAFFSGMLCENRLTIETNGWYNNVNKKRTSADERKDATL